MATLHITFSGLCLFVRARDGKSMNVLMPFTGGHIGHPVPKHRVLIESPGLFVSLEGWELDLSHLSGSLDPRLPDDLANISKYGKGKVRFSALKGKAVTRVQLHSGGITYTAGLAKWEYPCEGPVMRMAHYVRWSISGLPGPWIPLKRRKLFGGGAAEEFALVPTDQFGNAYIIIHHLPEDEFFSTGTQKPPKPCDPPGHFGAFHHLLTGAGSIYPGFKEVDPYGEDFPFWGDDERNAAVPWSRAGKTFTCMAASADAE